MVAITKNDLTCGQMDWDPKTLIAAGGLLATISLFLLYCPS